MRFTACRNRKRQRHKTSKNTRDINFFHSGPMEFALSWSVARDLGRKQPSVLSISRVRNRVITRGSDDRRIAGSMITVAGVVFSITIVALSLASAQFGPRLLGNFIRDRRNQMVLGTFTATFLYCLLILRTVRGMDHQQFVPGVSVTVGILLAIANLGILIYFIHHVAISIQATSVIRSVSDELQETIDRLWPDDLGDEPPEACELPTPFQNDEAIAVLAEASGYVDAIQDSLLIRLGKEHGLIVRLALRPGHFVVERSPLVWAWPPDRMSDEIAKGLNKAFVLANHRTSFQDVELTNWWKSQSAFYLRASTIHSPH